MTCNMDWLRAIINKSYIFLSGLSDHELFGVFCIPIIALTIWVLIANLPDMINYLKRKCRARKARKATPKTFAGARTGTVPKIKTVAPPAYNNRASNCPQKIKTISSPIPRAFSVKSDLDVEKLKKILN